MNRMLIGLFAVASAIVGVPAAMAQSTEIKTEYLMSYYVPLERHPIDPTAIVVNVKPGGWVKGPQIAGKVIPPGGDWARIMPSGAIRLDVRLLIETDDNAKIHMSYNGVFVLNKEAIEALNRGEAVTHQSVPYFVTAPTFQTSSEKYDYLNKVQAVGKMVEFKRSDPMHIKYDVFVVR